MQFTYRNPDRSTDPGRILPGASALVVGAWSYRHEQPPGGDRPGANRSADRPGGPVRPSGSLRLAAAGRWPRSPTPCGTGVGGPRWSATTTGWSTGPPPTGPGSAGSARTRCCSCPGSARGRCWARWSPTPRSDPPPRGAVHPTREGCGTCSRCLTACPTGALVAPGVLDARRCLAWLVQAPGSFPEQYRRALGDRIYGCDECQQVCPINRVADRRDPPPPPRARQRAHGGPPRHPRSLRRGAAGRPRPLVHRRPRPPLPAPECAGGPGQRG